MERRLFLAGAWLASSMVCGCGSFNASPSDGGTSDGTLPSDATGPTDSGADASVLEAAARDAANGADSSDAGADAQDAAADDTGTGPVCMTGTASMACPTCAAPQVCCVQRCPLGSTGVFASCGDTTCNGQGGALQCLGPQDCDGGICCGSGANNAPLDTFCVAGTTCPSTRQLIVCRTVADCPAPVNFRCANGMSTAGIYSTCRSDGGPVVPPTDAGSEDAAPDGGSEGDAADAGDAAHD